MKLPRIHRLTKNMMLNWLLLFLAVMQASSQFLEFYMQDKVVSEPSVLKIWLSLGNEITNNWAAFSATLTFLVLGCLLYSRLVNNSDTDVKRTWVEPIFLLIVNLSLCIRIYSNESVSEKIEYIGSNLPGTIVVAIIITFAITGILLISNNQTIKKEINEIYKQKNGDSSNENSKVNNEERDSSIAEQELTFRMRHPFSYAFRSFVGDFENRKRIKREYKKEMIRLKTEEKRVKATQKLDELGKKGFHNDKLGTVAVVISLILCIALFVTFGFTENGKAAIESFNEIINIIVGINESMEHAEQSLTSFLSSAGVLFLFVVFFFTIFILIYIVVSVLIYILTNVGQDTDIIQKRSKLIKVFVFGIIDGAIRPLLFLPDFLKCVEESVLEVNLDEKINELYPDNESSEHDDEGDTDSSLEQDDISNTQDDM